MRTSCLPAFMKKSFSFLGALAPTVLVLFFVFMAERIFHVYKSFARRCS
jgi:hypothetical protein